MQNIYKNIIIVKSNILSQDTRVPKEIDVLYKRHIITFLGWNRIGKSSIIDYSDRTIKCREISFNFRSSSGKGVLINLPCWWAYIFVKLMVFDFDIVHIINLDSAFPAILAAKIRQKKIVYEILDTYEDFLKLNTVIRKFIIFFDKILQSKSNAVILADDAQIEEFGGIPNRTVVAIYDSPPETTFFSQKNNIKNKNFILFYAGVLLKDRRLNLDKMLEIVKDLDGVELIIAGNGDMIDLVKSYAQKFPNKIKYVGRIDYSHALKIYSNSDCTFVLRDSSTPIVNKYICGSTLLNAMMCGIPVIVNKDTSTAKKVQEEQCGLVVDAHDADEIKRAIILLRDNKSLRKVLGKNGRIAYERKYGWDIMAKKLLNLYSELYL